MIQPPFGLSRPKWPWAAILLALLAACSEDDTESSDTAMPVSAGSPCDTNGAKAPADDGCNSCVCDGDVWSCTEKACIEPCEDGATKPADDGCNTCTCQSGEWQCTLIGCVTCPPPQETGEACAQVVVFAKDPASGMCCEYGSPCTAPEAWSQFYSIGECDAGGGATLSWFSTCGDPVCGPGSDAPTGEQACDTEQMEGTSCSVEGGLCDPGIGCGTNLVCASSDPKLQPGGCPISRASFKQDIEYVSDAERASLARDLLETPLATFRYRGSNGRRQLGFIIEDIEPSPAVDAPRDRVDLYGYTTMTVAALQQQAFEIERLRAELGELQARFDGDFNACQRNTSEVAAE
jgi:hypothetical protein